MELLDLNWEYYVNNNCLEHQFVQIDKLDRSKVFELAKYDLTELFKIYDQLDINSKILNELKFRDLKSKIINKLEELKINYEIKKFKDEYKIFLPIENLSIIINKERICCEHYVNCEYTGCDYKIRNEVYLIKWNDKSEDSSDHISFTGDKTRISFVVKDKYTMNLFSYFKIPANPKERFVEQNYWKFNAKPPKNLNWHETFRIGTCQLP